LKRIRNHIPFDASESIVPLLRGASLKVTKTRLEIARYLAITETPLAVAELHERSAARHCNLTTIYRNLVALEAAGLVLRQRDLVGPTRFAWKRQAPPPVIARTPSGMPFVPRTLSAPRVRNLRHGTESGASWLSGSDPRSHVQGRVREMLGFRPLEHLTEIGRQTQLSCVCISTCFTSQNTPPLSYSSVGRH
jgi:hypothetical protein